MHRNASAPQESRSRSLAQLLPTGKMEVARVLWKTGPATDGAVHEATSEEQ